MLLSEIKNEVVRDHTGKPLRGLAKELALRAKADRVKGPEPKIKDEMVGNAKVVKEEALDTKKAEDVWSENSDSASSYRTSTTYEVRKIKDTDPPKYEVFSVNGTTRKPYGKMDAVQLKSALQPIRPNQTPDAEGFTTYVGNDSTEAFRYDGDPVKVMLGDVGARLNKGDYLVRTNDGNDFVYSVQTASSFEGSMKKV